MPHTSQVARRRGLAARSVVAALVGLVLCFGQLAATETSSSAYTWKNTFGRPGAVTLWQAEGVHIRICSQPYSWSCRMAPGIHLPAQRVHRSPSTKGSQRVAVLIRIQRWTGSHWVKQTQVTRYRTIPRGSRYVLTPEWTALPTHVNYLRVQLVVTWASPRGRALGKKVIWMNQSGDYVCKTNLHPCTAGAGWLFIREPGV